MDLCQSVLPRQGRRHVIGHLSRDTWVLQCLLASDLKKPQPTNQTKTQTKKTKTPTKPNKQHLPSKTPTPPPKNNKKVYYINRRFEEPLLLDPTLLHDGKRIAAILAKYNQTEECVGYDSSVPLVSSQSSKLKKLLLAVFWEFRHNSFQNFTEFELTL